MRPIHKILLCIIIHSTTMQIKILSFDSFIFVLKVESSGGQAVPVDEIEKNCYPLVDCFSYRRLRL